MRSAIGGVNIPGVPDSVARPVGRLRSKLMFLPIISYADGYGFTYGGRVSTVDLLGIDERLSVPLTWGGTRRAALEFERLFKTGPLTRIASSLAIWNRENPRYEIRDQRVEVKGRAERVFADVFRAGIDASSSTISFGTLDDDLWTLGTSAGIDTRLDPAFPGNAILTTVGWTGMHFRTIPGPVNRFSADARGYLRAFRQIVVAGRAAYTGADASLPPYERLLLGGSSSRARIRHRCVRRRSDVRHLRGSARADHLGAERGEAGADGVLRRRQGLGLRQQDGRRAVAPRRRRRGLPDRVDRADQPGHRARAQDGRHARASVVGVYVLTRSDPKLQIPAPRHSQRQSQRSPTRASSRDWRWECLGAWLDLGFDETHPNMFFTTNHTFAGRSASRRMYHGNQYSP